MVLLNNNYKLCLGSETIKKIHLGNDLVYSVADSIKLLLDEVPIASIAYSIRKLSTAYTGFCLRLRRESDNLEQDFGFLNGYLDSESIDAFLGASTGYVVKWYDQSDNNNHAIQPNIQYQPKLDLSSNKPALLFDDNGSNSFEFNDISNIRTLFFKLEYSSTANQVLAYLLGSDTNYDFHAGSSGVFFNTQYCSPFITNGTIKLNNSNVAANTKIPENSFVFSINTTGNLLADRISKDRYFPDRGWQGTYSELLIFSDVIDNLTTSNINQNLID